MLGLLCPFYLFMLDFKTVEELQLQPQTEEEYEDALHDDRSSASSDSESSLSSRASSASDVSSHRMFRRRRHNPPSKDTDVRTPLG
jgi:hypothetical protein